MYQLERQDIQGIISFGYGNLDAAAYALLHIQNAPLTKRWLSNLVDQVQTSQERPSERGLNIAFTYEGLAALGLPESALTTFSTEFQEGMTEPNRSRVLGDHQGSENDPQTWLWGGPNSQTVHILLLLFAKNDAQLDEFYSALESQFATNGVELIRKLETKILKDEDECLREHFGFRDAISQPSIEGLHRAKSPNHLIKAGEFILGYPNEYNLLTESPRVKPDFDPQNLLPPGEFGSHDLGRNGSYLVFRQLSQNVEAFWRFLDTTTRNTDGSSQPQARLKLAAKMVGRWPSGTSLVQSPEQDDPTVPDQNDFVYHHSDAQGLRCPVGAHIRRTNPRDSLGPAPGTERSIAVNKTHRLLRRGRTYGEPISASFDPDAILNSPNPEGERGIHFICINANISRQFEFVQHTWINNPKFNGLYQETDPLMGDRQPGELGKTDRFTEPATPIRHCVKELPQFVTVRGGAYFFLPGIKAIRYLASLS
ncbi:Dyp-type peroxidase [Leptolyngbya sp. NK1-12]|uniref:Dyp-type peroxidase n=1 Tax=Leptolyngbya sp. NK1-12 TaxID=2547451 RepID=A0AA97ASS1_9CYAN|nr:Dyp-type peroxidase [Leptolyngbya sp. NK1-12]WNZ27558.1 Dyp-type peroxidase [Leptolyngbya sp. NK1-12]